MRKTFHHLGVGDHVVVKFGDDGVVSSTQSTGNVIEVGQQRLKILFPGCTEPLSFSRQGGWEWGGTHPCWRIAPAHARVKGAAPNLENNVNKDENPFPMGSIPGDPGYEPAAAPTKSTEAWVAGYCGALNNARKNRSASLLELLMMAGIDPHDIPKGIDDDQDDVRRLALGGA